MTPTANRLGSWTLFVKDEAGKEFKGGRFLTSFLARQFVEDYRIDEWRLEGPDGQTDAP